MTHLHLNLDPAAIVTAVTAIGAAIATVLRALAGLVTAIRRKW